MMTKENNIIFTRKSKIVYCTFFSADIVVQRKLQIEVCIQGGFFSQTEVGIDIRGGKLSNTVLNLELAINFTYCCP